MIGPDANPGDAQLFTFCGENIDLKQAVFPTTERFGHTVNEADRTFVELDQQGLDYDVILDIGGEKLSAHKELLMAHIPYFRAIFSHSFAESSSDLVPMTFDNCGFEPAYIHSIIRSLYDGHFDLSTDNLDNWLEAAIYLNADTIIEACCRFKFTRVRCDEALSLLGRFRSIGCHALDDRLWRFIDANFVPISHSAAFKELSVEELIVIIQRHTLRVLDAVNGWMAVDRARWVEGARLLNSLRLSSLSIRHIDSAIESVEWVKADPDCVTLLNENKSPEHRRSRSDRYCKDTVALLCAADTNDRRYRRANIADRRVRIFNVLNKEWTVIPLPWALRSETPSVAIGQKLFYLGYNGSRTRVLDTTSNEWSVLPGMHAGFIWGTAVAVIDDVIYVVGGADSEDNATTALIALDTKADNPAWTQLAPMTSPRFNAASCVHMGMLYVFGGSTGPWPINGNTVTATAECYNPNTNQWFSIAPMRRPMSCHSAAAAHDRIYVIGRPCDRPWDNIYDAYVPATDSWTRLPVVPEEIQRERAVVVGGRLLTWSLWNGDMKTFDIEANEWKVEMWVWRGEDASEELSTTWMRVPAAIPLPLAAIEEPWHMFDELRRPAC